MILDAHNYSHIASATTTQVYTGPCVLKNITVNTTAAGTITVYDETSATSVVVAILKSNVNEGTYVYNVPISRGIKIVTAAASDITVTYSV